MARYQLKEPAVDILKITGMTTTYTLDDGSSVPAPSGTPPANMYYVEQTQSVITADQLANEYSPL